MNLLKITEGLSATDRAYADKMAAEALEQIAYEAYQRTETPEFWLAHQRAVDGRDTAHARYLDLLIAEQAELANH